MSTLRDQGLPALEVRTLPAAPLPDHEPKRLAALRALQVLDSGTDAALDRLIELTARLLDVPMAAISLVDIDRQWFKASVGLDVPQTPREQSFCAYTILDDRPNVVTDAAADPRFADNQLVTSGMISAYAGVPLVTSDGQRIGALCAIDGNTRSFDEDQLRTLEDLAATAMCLLEQHVTNRMLAETRNTLAGVFDSALDGICALEPVRDTQGKITDFVFTAFNHASETLTGRLAGEVLGKRLSETFPGNFPDGLFDRYAEVARSGEPTTFEHYYQHDGVDHTFRISVSPCGDGVAITYADISERMRAQRALAESEARFERAVGGTSDGLWEWAVGTENVWYAPRFKALLGYEPDELPDTLDTFISNLHPDDKDRVWSAVEQHLDDASVYDVQYRLRCKDEQYRWFRARGQAQRDWQGRPVSMSGSISEIEDIKRVESQLRGSRERYRQMYNATPVMLHSIDADGKLVSVSDYWCEHMGYTREEVLGRKSTEFLTPESREKAKETIPRFMADGEIRDVSYQFVTKSGAVRDVLLSATAEHDETGRYVRSLAVIVDVTEQAEAQRELAEARDAAEQSSKSKSEFLANMSHEIRTPMTAIMGFADLLADPSQSDADRHNCIQTIRRNSRHLLEIINDILDLSKIEAGKMEAERIETDLTQVVADVASLMRGRAIEKGLDLHVEYLTPVPDKVVTDPTRLRQVLMNLVGNAVKFTEAGGVRLAVKVDPDSDPQQPRLKFDVIDTGIGIPQDQIDKLFNAFTQADTSHTRRFGGTGLGLAISLRLAKMLGGDIGVTSTEGEGSTFAITVPTRKADNATLIQRPEEAGARTPGGAPSGQDTAAPVNSDKPLEGIRILLAEDGPDNQRLIGFILRKAGADVVIVENGQAAVEVVQRTGNDGEPFDVILMDMQMPVLDGYAATEQIRKNGWSGPLFALTAHAMPGDRDRCIAAGCDDYLTKPINRAVLIETLSSTRSQAA